MYAYFWYDIFAKARHAVKKERTIMASTTRKARRSFTLSHESVTYLEVEKRQRRAPSVSAVLDDILRAKRRESEREKLDAAVSAYYDSLPDVQVAEDEKWGEFAETHFSAE